MPSPEQPAVEQPDLEQSAQSGDALSGLASPSFELDAAWDLHPQVAVRPEPFGALLYHFGTRRLSFLKEPALLAVLLGLPGQDTVRSACAAAGLDPVPVEVAAALGRLDRTGMIVRRRP